MTSPPGKKTNVLSYFSTCLFQDYTHGFLLINLLFALSYFLCHNSYLFFSVLVVWTVHASFRVYFQVVKTVFFYVLIIVLMGYKLCEALDSHCVTNTSYSFFFFFPKSLFTPSLYLCLTPLLQHNESVRFSPFLHSSVEKSCSLRLGDCAPQAWSALTNQWPAVIWCPAAPPDIAGRWPNLAWDSKKLWRYSTDTFAGKAAVLTLCSECVSQGRCSQWKLS